MDLDTEFRRRQAALAAANPSLRTAAAQNTTQPSVLAPITSANLPAPVVQQPVVQSTQQTPTATNGYSLKQRADKGFDFFDPSGNKTTIENYTANTGVNGSDLRQGLAAAGDKVSQQIIANDTAKAQPKQNFIQSLPNAAVQFGKGIGSVLRTFGGGIVDGVNFLTRIPQTVDTAKDNATLALDQALGINNKQDLANAGTTQKNYGNAQKEIQDFANLVSGDKTGNSNADTTREAKAISTGKATPGEVVSAILKSLTAATTVPVGKVASGGGAVLKEGVADAESTATNPGITEEVASTLTPEELKIVQDAGVPVTKTNTSKPFAELDEATKTKMNELNTSSTASPVQSGFTRLYQTNDNLAQKSDQYFKDPDTLANYINGRADNSKLGYIDVPNDMVQAVPGKPQVFKVTGGDTTSEAKLATGTSDAIPAETTSPDVAQADISAQAGYKAIADEKAAQPADIASESNSNIQSDQKLLSNVTDTTKNSKDGSGFVTAPEAHPLIAPITKRLNEIDRSLSDVATGKNTLSRDEITSLKSERDGLITQAREPFTSEGVTTANTTGKVKPTAAGKKTVTADTAAPDATPEEKVAIQKVLDELNPAERAYSKKQKTVAQQKASRIAQANAAYEKAGGGEAGMKAKYAALGGKYKASDFQPLNLDDATKKSLLDKVQKSDLRDFEKFNTQNALSKVWGSNPEKPAAHDIAYIRKFFNSESGPGVGDELASGIQKAIDEGKSWEDIASDISGLPRALMSTLDLSGLGRQGLPLGTRFPKEYIHAQKESVKYAFSPKYFEKEMKRMSESDDYATITDKLGVDLPGIAGVADEGFIGAGLAEKIPVAKIAIKASDRAYTGGLTNLRYNVSSRLIKEEGGVDQFLKNMKETYGEASVKRGLFGGKQIAKDERAMKALGEVINTFTGRGGMKGGILDEHMKTASTFLFAPRLWAANLNRLNPAFYARLARDNPKAAKLALQSQGTFFGVAGLTMGLAAAAGASVGMDPRSADFGKIKVGNTRYDILGGQQQNVVLLARLLTGQKTNSDTGEVTQLGQGYGTKTRTDLITDMFNNKSNPLLAFGLRLLNASPDANGNLKDEFGQDYNPLLDAGKLFVPLGIQGDVETAIDTGSIPQGILMNVPSFFGVGTQTYGTVATKDKYVDPNGKVSFKGKLEPDMVPGPDGKALLDSKGNVVRITIDKNSTPAEIAALKTSKAQTTLRDNFVAGQSKEDQALMKLNKDQLAGQVTDGTISQDKVDHIDSLNAQASVQGDSNPANVQSGVAKKFYSTYDAMSAKEQAAYLSGPADDNSKTITDQVNAQRTAGLDEFKPSNQVAKLYSDYEKDIVSHPEYTAIDKQNKAKAFQVSAEKANYTTQQSDLYTEGGSDDTQALLDSGAINKTDLDKAIELDNQLYNSGVTSSLKFSKKFRAAYGYNNADGSSGSSGSSASDVTSFLPSASSASQGKKPTFSSKSRSQKVSFGVKLPSKSTKKISIKL